MGQIATKIYQKLIHCLFASGSASTQDSSVISGQNAALLILKPGFLDPVIMGEIFD